MEEHPPITSTHPAIMITERVYEQHIPSCCKLRTFNEHAEILGFCWGLMNSIPNGHNCGTCEFNVDPAMAAKLIEDKKRRAYTRLIKDLT